MWVVNIVVVHDYIVSGHMFMCLSVSLNVSALLVVKSVLVYIYLLKHKTKFSSAPLMGKVLLNTIFYNEIKKG